MGLQDVSTVLIPCFSLHSVISVLIPLSDSVQDLKILTFFTPLPIRFELNLSTSTEGANSLNVA